MGENLQDHFGVAAEYRSSVKSTVNDLYNNKLKGGLQLLRYLLFRTGHLRTTATIPHLHSFGPRHQPTDMMITFMAWCTDEQLKPRPFSGFTILAEHMRPDSKGHVRIKSPNASDQPAIRFNFLASDADRNAALSG